MIFVISVFFSFISVVFATPLFVNLLRSLEIVDNPDYNRKIHSEPIPRMGGVIIYSVVILFLFFLFPSLYEIKYFLIGSLVIFLLGAADDLWNLKWSFKFLGQSVAAVFLILYLVKHNYFNFNFIGIPLPAELTTPLMFVFIVGVLNAFNMLDGLDGLVSGFTLIVAAISFLLSFGSDSVFVPLLSILLIGTTLGFLKFNSNPANIFLGDSGSLLLAYLTLTTFLSATAEISKHSIDLGFVIIILSVPIIDTLRVMIVRILNRRNPFLPDKNHIHHIIYSKKIRHKTTVFIILFLTVLSVLIGVYYFYSSKTTGLLVFALFAGTLISFDKIITFIVKKENLLLYGRLIKNLPNKLAEFFKFSILPTITFILFSLIAYLLFTKASFKDPRYVYLFIFNLLTIAYVLINQKNRNHSSELFVLVNFFLFFYITGSGDLYYKLFPVPIIKFINLNQVITLVMIPVITLFFLLRDKLLKSVNDSFLSGLDLIIALMIISIYLFVKFSGFGQEYYQLSDTLIRSFLFYLLYKIIVTCFPKIGFQLYFTTFAFVIIALLRILIF